MLSLADKYQLTQHVPRGAVTRYGAAGAEPRISESTLDLIWSTPGITNRFIRCRVREDLDHQSDHYSVEAIFEVNVDRQTPKATWAWTGPDKEVMARVLHAELPGYALDTNEWPVDQAINEWLKDFFSAINDAAEQSTPRSNVAPAWSKPGFTPECKQAVHRLHPQAPSISEIQGLPQLPN